MPVVHVIVLSGLSGQNGYAATGDLSARQEENGKGTTRRCFFTFGADRPEVLRGESQVGCLLSLHRASVGVEHEEGPLFLPLAVSVTGADSGSLPFPCASVAMRRLCRPVLRMVESIDLQSR